jgi:hypothetical protein
VFGSSTFQGCYKICQKGVEHNDMPYFNQLNVMLSKSANKPGYFILLFAFLQSHSVEMPLGKMN